MLAAKLRHVVAFGDCAGAFSQAPLEEEVKIEPPPEAQEDRGVAWKRLRALRGFKGSPKDWHKQWLTGERLTLTQAHADGCVFFDVKGGRQDVLSTTS